MNPMFKVELLRAACCVAGIDGEIDEAEFAVLKKLADDVGVGDASLSAMMNRAKSDPDFYQEQFRVLKADPKESMAVLLQVALADRNVVDGEKVVLAKLGERLGVTQAIFDELMSRVQQM